MLSKTLLACLSMLLCTTLCGAQIDPEKEKDIRRLLELSGQVSTSFLQTRMDQLAEQLKEAVAPEHAAAFVEAFSRKAVAGILDFTYEVSVPGFDAVLSKEEIEQLIVFWESPLGLRFRKAQIETEQRFQETETYRRLLSGDPTLFLQVLEGMEGDFPELKQFRLSLEAARDEALKEASGGDQLLSGTDYVNRTASLRLTIPEGWVIDRKKRPGVAGTVISPDGSQAVVITRQDLAGSLDEFLEAYIARHREKEGFVQLEPSRLVLDGKDAVRLVAGYSFDGKPYRFILTVVVDEGAAVGILLLTPHEGFEDAKPIIETISNSYRTLTRMVEGGGMGGEGAAPVQITAGAEVKMVYRVDPIYPKEAKEERIEGTVELRVKTDEQGSVTAIEVLDGHPILAKAAVEAVRQWGYSPFLVEGKPTPVIFGVSVNFVLQ